MVVRLQPKVGSVFPSKRKFMKRMTFYFYFLSTSNSLNYRKGEFLSLTHTYNYDAMGGISLSHTHTQL